MGGLQYIKYTNWKSFAIDWREYKDLRKYCRILKKSKQQALSDLTCYKQDHCNNSIPLKCIRIVTHPCINPCSQEDLINLQKIEYCKNFFSSISKCRKSGCPYCGLNNKYNDIKTRYQYWLNIKRNFWSKKKQLYK